MMTPEQLNEIQTALKQLDNLKDVADVVDDHLGVENKDKPIDERIHAQMSGLLAALESEKRKTRELAEAANQHVTPL
jgi:hypothetical protein